MLQSNLKCWYIYLHLKWKNSETTHVVLCLWISSCLMLLWKAKVLMTKVFLAIDQPLTWRHAAHTDVCVEVSAVCWLLSASHGHRLHVVQHPAAASWPEDPLPVGGSCDQRGHMGHGSVGIRLPGMSPHVCSVWYMWWWTTLQCVCVCVTVCCFFHVCWLNQTRCVTSHQV